MKLPNALVSPPPTTAWSLDDGVAAAIRRDRRGAVTAAFQEVPAGTFEIGPVGLQSVDPARLEPVVRSVQERASGASRAAVVLPSGWLRCHLLDFDQLPRKRGEVEDVLRWRLKRLLPVPPTELRMAWVQLGAPDGTRRLFTSVAYRRAIDTLEEVLVTAGVQPGLLTSRLLAVATAIDAESTPRLLLQGEPGFVSMLLVLGGVPRLLRTKPLSDDVAADAIDRELGLALHYIRDTLAVSEPIEVAVTMHDPQVEAAVLAWVERQPGLHGRRSSSPDTIDAAFVREVGAARAWPLWAAVGGAA